MYKANYVRVETRVISITCMAENEDEASEKFDEMVSNSLQQEGDASEWIDFDNMECIDAEDYVQDIMESDSAEVA